MCRDHGWREFNPSVSGRGFIHNRTLFGVGDLPDLIIRQHPDIVIVTMGLNDNFSFGVAAPAVHGQIGADLRRMEHALPRATALGQQVVEAGMRVGWFHLEDLGALIRAHRFDDSVNRVVARILLLSRRPIEFTPPAAIPAGRPRAVRIGH